MNYSRDSIDMDSQRFIHLVSILITMVGLILVMILCMCTYLVYPIHFNNTHVSEFAVAPKEMVQRNNVGSLWQAPDSLDIPVGPEGDLIIYGRELIAHTSVYLGPKGIVSQTTNGMNCQNCHLKSGTKPFGNNYSTVYSTYPQVRSRSGKMVSIEERVNGCLERSLNGHRLKVDSKEMIAIKAYFKWVGREVEAGERPDGAGIWPLPFIDRPADPVKGMVVYEELCQRCHGPSGQGQLLSEGNQWLYPPLWGEQSYNTGAGLFRVSRLAGYVKTNMPLGITYDNPELTDEQAWDVAAYVNSMPRPQKEFPNDWPDIDKKPFDHPFGPYSDTFPEVHHKYGPFAEIVAVSRAKK